GGERHGEKGRRTRRGHPLGHEAGLRPRGHCRRVARGPAALRARVRVRDTASGEPMTTDLSMRIGSNSRAFTVTALLQLVDQGKLRLDDPIDKYVAGVPNGKEITLQHLAAMRSGLYNYTDELIPKLATDPDRQWTPEELLAISFKHAPLFKPGTDFDYSSTNTALLGVVIEKVTGLSHQAYIDKHILKPEGLTHTVFPAGAETPSSLVHGYFKMP